MKSLSTFILAFCVVSVGIGALFMLSPKGNLSKSVRYVFGLIFLCCLMPSISIFKGFTVSTDTQYIFENGYSSSLAETVITQTFEKALTKNGINFSKILVFTDKTENGSITISEVVIYSTESKDKIMAVIGQTEDIKVSVIGE